MAKKRTTTAPVTAVVESIDHLSPNFVRIVFSGPEMATVGSTDPVYDQRIKLIFPGRGQPLPDIPEDGDWYPNWLAIPEENRGAMRTYSIRCLEMLADTTRLTVDFVLHLSPGLTGPASTWASMATVGDEILIIAPRRDADPLGGIEFNHGDANCIVLAGDETAAPAIARILEDLVDTDLTGTALIEIPQEADILPITGPSGIEVKWLPRNGRTHGELLLENLDITDKVAETTPMDSGSAPDAGELLWETPGFSATGEKLEATATAIGEYYWIAGESGVVTHIRRALIKDKGLNRSQVAFMGYWKRGVSMRG